MTPQEIISAYQKLPPAQKQEIYNSVADDLQKPKMTEEEFERMLHAEGIIGNIPNRADYTDEDDDFDPIEVEGEPLSEMIIRERR